MCPLLKGVRYWKVFSQWLPHLGINIFSAIQGMLLGGFTVLQTFHESSVTRFLIVCQVSEEHLQSFEVIKPFSTKTCFFWPFSEVFTLKFQN